jgi:hypothetical protein
MTNFTIPWKFLDISDDPKALPASIDPVNVIPNAPAKPKSFAQALTNICDIPLSQIPQPVVKGDRLAIEIPEVYYEAGLEACKHNLHGRIIWPKGSTPLSVAALKVKLEAIWKDLSKWGVISLGKGFFEFSFSSLEDVRRVRSVPSWNLQPGLLKLFAWSKDFNPRQQHHTSVQVWVRIYGLSQEYWHKNILFTIAGSLGTPICMDSITAKPMHERTFGQFARILVDIDLMQPLRYKLLVERKGFAFFVDLEYEHIPEFCSECKFLGHSIENCKRLARTEEARKTTEQVRKKNVNPGSKQMYVAVPQGNNQASGPSNVEKEIVNIIDESNEDNHVVAVAHDNADSFSNNQAVSTLPGNARASQAILTPLSPKSIIQEKTRMLQQQLVDDDDDSSSQGSFVNATQVIENINPHTLPGDFQAMVIHTNAADINIERIPPDRVIKDMNFLKESWANLVESEMQNPIDETNEDQTDKVDDDGFQVQLSKGQIKAQKKLLLQASRDSYTTRSKVSPKPSK